MEIGRIRLSIDRAASTEHTHYCQESLTVSSDTHAEVVETAHKHSVPFSAAFSLSSPIQAPIRIQPTDIPSAMSVNPTSPTSSSSPVPANPSKSLSLHQAALPMGKGSPRLYVSVLAASTWAHVSCAPSRRPSTTISRNRLCARRRRTRR